jgi:hypothetical protein
MVVEGTLRQLRIAYVDADIAAKMEEAIRVPCALMEIEGVISPRAFAALLTADLREASANLRIYLRPIRRAAPFGSVWRNSIRLDRCARWPASYEREPIKNGAN